MNGLSLDCSPHSAAEYSPGGTLPKIYKTNKNKKSEAKIMRYPGTNHQHRPHHTLRSATPAATVLDLRGPKALLLHAFRQWSVFMGRLQICHARALGSNGNGLAPGRDRYGRSPLQLRIPPTSSSAAPAPGCVVPPAWSRMAAVLFLFRRVRSKPCPRPCSRPPPGYRPRTAPVWARCGP